MTMHQSSDEQTRNVDSFPSAVGAPETTKSIVPRKWQFAIALALAVFIVYQPVWHGGFIWDDNAHVTRPDLRSWQGLYRIWFDMGATQQYYPMLHSAFWIEHKIWGDATLGYHLTNILQHVIAAVLLAIILRRLSIPGAYLAAAIFALHPVHVESVAWITEQKNTLSAVFYLGSALAYLHFDESRDKRLYAVALVLFVLGLLSKTVTATLPAALLVIFWWQRGKLSWRRDVWPLVPFFVLGAAAGCFTAWLERALGGAEGADFDLTIIERCLLAGRVVWFYLGKLFWPSELLFIYPRWKISQNLGSQYLFPALLLLLLGILWCFRLRWRGPLAGVLYFVGTLFPVLGFFNVYPFMYSYVADHFQYLASLGIIVMASSGIFWVLNRYRLWGTQKGDAACLILLSVLACLTWQHCRMYADVKTLYRTTIDRNPTCWMAYNNLALIYIGHGQIDEGIAYLEKALELRPQFAQAHTNLGIILAARGKTDEAIAHHLKALEIKPDYVDAHNNLGNVLAKRGELDKAIDHYRQVLKFKPNHIEANLNLGILLSSRGRFDEAIVHYKKALELATLQNRQAMVESIRARIRIIEAKTPSDVPMAAPSKQP
jgi:protein O-mannosyl-transferase